MNTLDKNKIYLDEEGYEERFDEIGSLRNDLNEVSKENAGGDQIGAAGYYNDMPVHIEELGKEARIKAEKERKRIGLLNAEPIREHGIEGVVDINDGVKLKLTHSDGRISDGVIYTLVARNARNFKEVSINSTLGRVIYKAIIGEEGLEYDTTKENITTHTNVEVQDIIRKEKVQEDAPKSLG